MNRNILNALSIDVEDWFHILDVDQAPSLADWACLPSIVQRNIERLLVLLEETGSKCTCFVLGWIAEHHPQILSDLAKAGHDIASHGYAHELVYQIGPERFYSDVAMSLDIIRDVTGHRPTGYRAPGFSITDAVSDWAFEALADLGIDYDSSLFQENRGMVGVGRQLPSPTRFQFLVGVLLGSSRSRWPHFSAVTLLSAEAICGYSPILF